MQDMIEPGADASGVRQTPSEPDIKVSVCVVTYNQEAYIEDCLRSLVEQETDFPVEIIVFDDCSSDNTPNIVAWYAERYPHVVPYFRTQNVGAYRNYLEAHAAARGQYVAHMDGDDYALPGKLQAQADALDRDADCNAVWHSVDLFDDHGGFCSGATADLSSFGDGRVVFGDAIRLGHIGVHSSLMYRRSARPRITDFGRPRLDMHLMLELLSTGRGLMLDRVLGRYRMNATGSLQAASIRRQYKLSLDHAQEFFARFPRHRRDFMIFALSYAAIAAKNGQLTALNFIGFAFKTRTWAGPGAIAANLRRMRSITVKWQSRGRWPKQQPAWEA